MFKEYFNNIPLTTHDHLKGLITDGSDFPFDSVQDCLNMDFEPGETKKRLPYAAYEDLSDIIPQGSTILGIYPKVFVDADGTEKEVFIIAVNTGAATPYQSTVKLYITDYFNPTSDYGNNHNGSTNAWSGSAVELTEMKDIDIDTVTTTAGGHRVMLTVDDNDELQALPDDYYKGFTILNYNGTTNPIVGFITHFDADNGADGSDFYILVNSYVTKYTDGNTDTIQPYSFSATPPDNKFVLCRFPVMAQIGFDGNDISNFTADTISIVEYPNAVQISCGKDNRMLWLGFLTEKHYFGDAPDSGGIAINITGITNAANGIVTVNANHNYSDDDEIYINGVVGMGEVNNKIFTITVTGAGGLDKFKLNEDTTNYGTYQDVTTDFCYKINDAGDYKYTADWNGFWMGYDVANILNKKDIYSYTTSGLIPPGMVEYDLDEKKNGTTINTITGREISLDPDYDITTFYYEDSYKELGIIFRNDIYSYLYGHVGTNDEYAKDDIFAICSEFDGFQTIFNAIFIAEPFTTPPDNYAIMGINRILIYQPTFDRRLSAIVQFLQQDNYQSRPLDELDFAIIPTQLSEIQDGYKKINEDDRVKGGQLLLYPQLYYFWSGYTLSQIKGSPGNTGKILNDYLNMTYYKDVYMKTDKIIKVGEDTLAINISNDSVSTDPDNDKNGYCKVALSLVQNDGVNSRSIFCDERVKQITQGEPLITATQIVDNRILIFSKRHCFYYNIPDNIEGLTLQHIQTYQFKGTLGDKTLIKAQHGDEFAGIYWLNESSIYKFGDSAPVDILPFKWQKYYQQTITSNNKSSAVFGYLPRTKDIFIVLGSYIYLWNIIYQHWRKYYYPDTPQAFGTLSDSEEIIFLNGTSLFKTEGLNTAEWKDVRDFEVSPTKTPITFHIEKTITGGDRTVQKILDRIEAIYDTTLPAQTTPKIIISATANGTSIQSTTVEIDTEPEKSRINVQIASRKRNNYSTIKIESIPITQQQTDNYIKTFSIKELKASIKSTGKTIQKI
jgi:hypothetical protein